MKKKKAPLLQFSSRGIYCAVADVYLDPWRAVPKALITHGHADHARWGHGQYICTDASLPILKHRLGNIQVSGRPYGDRFLVNGVQFSFHPAGHVLGSAQIRVEYQGEVWVFTGDYKLENDGVSTPFEPIRCHTFISECTFGLPVFDWQNPDQIHTQINQWWATQNSDKRSAVLMGYSLGKAQRLLKHLDSNIGPIYTHSSITAMTEVTSSQVNFPQTLALNKEVDKNDLKGALILAPPAAAGGAWMKKLSNPSTGYASGWMSFRGARRRRGFDRGFVLSDHADWKGLLKAIKATGCEKVITTHGYTHLFAQYLREQGYDAITEKTAFEAETPAEETSTSL